MKSLFIAACLLLTTGQNAFCQTGDSTISITPKELKNNENAPNVIKNIGLNGNLVKLGFSLGYSYIPTSIYDGSISPFDNTLKLQKQFPANFLISTALVINPVEKYELLVNSDNKILKVIGRQLSNISFIATVNLVSIGSKAETLFNKKIDGGLGVGYRLNEDFHLALTAEMFSVKQLKDYIMDGYKDKVLSIDGQAVTALDPADTRLFTDKYVPGFSLKFIYILSGKP